MFIVILVCMSNEGCPTGYNCESGYCNVTGNVPMVIELAVNGYNYLR